MRPAVRDQLRSLAFERGGALAALVAVLYVWLACPYVTENDTAEFATLGALGGVAHPSGYPAYVLWLRAWSWLPGSSPAHTAALATAILGVAQVLVLHAACRAWGARALAATLAVGVYAVAPLVVRYNTSAEAFALNNLVVALVVWLAAAGGPLQGWRRAGTLGLVAGLGLANHMTCALVAPLGLLGVIRGCRERPAWQGAVAVGVGFALGMAPYLYLFVAPDHLMSWRSPTTIADLTEIVLRRVYGGPFGFSSLGQEVAWSDHVAELVRTVGRAWLWVLPFVGVTAVAVRLRRSDQGEPRVGWMALAVSLVLAGPLLVARFDMQLDAMGLWTVRRFHILPMLLLTIPVAIGLDLAGAALARRGVSPLVRRCAPLFVSLVLAAAAVSSLPYIQRFHSPAMELAVRNTLRSLPPHAVVIGVIDELDVGFRYLQLARGERPDVVFVRWQTAHWDWYRAKLHHAGLHLEIGPGDVRAQIAAQVHALGRPLFGAVNQAAADIPGYDRYPYGVLMHILPHGVRAPSLDEVVRINHELFSHFDLGYAFPGPHDDWATAVHVGYAILWRRLGDALEQAGQGPRAADAFELADRLAPSRR